MHDVLDYLESLASDMLSSSSIQYQNRTRIEAKEMIFTPMAKRNITLIFKGILSNVLLHSNASLFYFSLSMEPERISIELGDNGKGFEMESIHPTSYGLHSITHRVDEMYGRIDINSKPGAGTNIRISFPLNRSGIQISNT